jgi:hypothetical protein
VRTVVVLAGDVTHARYQSVEEDGRKQARGRAREVKVDWRAVKRVPRNGVEEVFSHFSRKKQIRRGRKSRHVTPDSVDR